MNWMQVKQEWIEALLSGDYEQGTQELCTVKNDGTYQFCCLGVLADVVDKSAWELVDGGTARRWHGHRSVLPFDLWDGTWGLAVSHETRLTERNDSGQTFAEIAEWIKENL